MTSPRPPVEKHPAFREVKKSRGVTRRAGAIAPALACFGLASRAAAQTAPSDTAAAPAATSTMSLDRESVWQGTTDGSSGNPGAVDVVTGTGARERLHRDFRPTRQASAVSG
jgi:hypothetical protein